MPGGIQPPNSTPTRHHERDPRKPTSRADGPVPAAISSAAGWFRAAAAANVAATLGLVALFFAVASLVSSGLHGPGVLGGASGRWPGAWGGGVGGRGRF